MVVKSEACHEITNWCEERRKMEGRGRAKERREQRVCAPIDRLLSLKHPPHPSAIRHNLPRQGARMPSVGYRAVTYRKVRAVDTRLICLGAKSETNPGTSRCKLPPFSIRQKRTGTMPVLEANGGCLQDR